MKLIKAGGGCTITGRSGRKYTWKTDGQAVEVANDDAADFLTLPGNDFSVPEEAPAKVTEPAPAAKTAVTEPAPKAAAAVTEGPPAAKDDDAEPAGK